MGSDSIDLMYLVCACWDYTDVRLMPLYRMAAAQRLNAPSQSPDEFKPDEPKVSQSENFAYSSVVEFCFS